MCYKLTNWLCEFKSCHWRTLSLALTCAHLLFVRVSGVDNVVVLIVTDVLWQHIRAAMHYISLRSSYSSIFVSQPQASNHCHPSVFAASPFLSVQRPWQNIPQYNNKVTYSVFANIFNLMEWNILYKYFSEYCLYSVKHYYNI